MADVLRSDADAVDEMREKWFLDIAGAEEKRRFLSRWTIHVYEKERLSRCPYPIRRCGVLPPRNPPTSLVLKMSPRRVLARSERNSMHRHGYERLHSSRGGRRSRKMSGR